LAARRPGGQAVAPSLTPTSAGCEEITPKPWKLLGEIWREVGVVRQIFVTIFDPGMGGVRYFRILS
jgi:hypothetical protein